MCHLVSGDYLIPRQVFWGSVPSSAFEHKGRNVPSTCRHMTRLIKVSLLGIKPTGRHLLWMFLFIQCIAQRSRKKSNRRDLWPRWMSLKSTAFLNTSVSSWPCLSLTPLTNFKILYMGFSAECPWLNHCNISSAPLSQGEQIALLPPWKCITLETIFTLFNNNVIVWGE